MANTLPPLPYAYDGLEPYISNEIMVLHHTKHHQTYVNALNTAEAAYAKASTPKERIALQAALKFNGGGNCFRFFLAQFLSEMIRTHQSFTLLEEPGTICRGSQG